jgi:glutathione S-transferase
VKLYFAPYACSLASHITLREAGLPFELVKVDLRKKLTASGEDYRAINPKGYVPALQLDDGDVLSEGVAIMQFIAEEAPQAGLAPTERRARAHLQGWLNYIATEVHKAFSPLWANPSDEVRAATVDRLGNRVGFVSAQLGDKPFLMGDQFTVADAYLFTVLSWSPMVGFDLSAWPNIGAYLARVGARPAVQAALAAENEARRV